MSLSWTSPLNEDVAVTSTPTDIPEARVSERIPIDCWARLSYETESGGRTIRGRVRNMSASGVLIETRNRIGIGSEVRLEANELLVGAAFVRHSTGAIMEIQNRTRIRHACVQPLLMSVLIGEPAMQHLSRTSLAPDFHAFVAHLGLTASSARCNIQPQTSRPPST